MIGETEIISLLAFLPKQTFSSILQSLDQGIGTARGDNGRELIASCREIADRSVEVDVDYPLAADEVIYAHGTPTGLQQPGLDDLAATARFRNRLRVHDEAFAGIIFDLARIVCNDESRKGIAGCRLLLRRKAFPGRAYRQPRHGREIEDGADDGRKSPVALAHAQPPRLLDRRHQLLIIGLDLYHRRTRRLRPQWEQAQCRNDDKPAERSQQADLEIPHRNQFHCQYRRFSILINYFIPAAIDPPPREHL